MILAECEQRNKFFENLLLATFDSIEGLLFPLRALKSEIIPKAMVLLSS